MKSDTWQLPVKLQRPQKFVDRRLKNAGEHREHPGWLENSQQPARFEDKQIWC